MWHCHAHSHLTGATSVGLWQRLMCRKECAVLGSHDTVGYFSDPCCSWKPIISLSFLHNLLGIMHRWFEGKGKAVDKRSDSGWKSPWAVSSDGDWALTHRGHTELEFTQPLGALQSLQPGKILQQCGPVYLKTRISGEAPTVLLILISKFIFKRSIFLCLEFWPKISFVNHPSQAKENNVPLNLKTISKWISFELKNLNSNKKSL